MSSYETTPRFTAAVAAFTEAHNEDPNLVPDPTNLFTQIPYSPIYHARLAHYVKQLSLPSQPSEPLLLAAHSQHIRRWTVPRSSYPEGLAGYRRWRAGLAKFHADTAEQILLSAGYDPTTIARVRDLLQKRNLATDEEVQLFEDSVCLVFLEKEFDAFAPKVSEEKLIDVVKKTWKKMGDKGHKAALELVGSMAEGSREVILKALTEPEPEEKDVLTSAPES
ncbi:hypothetical protein HDV00_008326 [Rhizophlyctis rosea]|nr:hypothetical protein HDV00_008326 [Rhizophlyctis rosea]